MLHNFQFSIVEATQKKEKKEYGMEHIKCGVWLFFISNPKKDIICFFKSNLKINIFI
jgi:hypothetical protein